MTISTYILNDQARISMDRRFECQSHREFKSAYMSLIEANPEVTTITVDLRGVEYIDSSALGMLLLLKERAGAAGKHVLLAGATGTIMQVLEVANFNRIFEFRND